jgi:hypothetical protein
MRLLRRIAVGILCGCLLFVPAKSRAESLNTAADQIVIGIVLVSAAIVVGIVLIVKHKPSITGCVTQGPGGLAIANEGDSKSYVLGGDAASIASIAAGQRVKVTGKKRKGANPVEFDVTEVKKNFGACPATHS